MADKKPISKAQQRAVTKYMATHYYRPNVMLYKELKEPVKQRADSLGLSVSDYLRKLIEADLGM